MKNYCKHCGEKLTPGIEHNCPTRIGKISAFLRKLLNNFSKNNKVDDEDYFEREKSIVPDIVKPDNGEIVIKQYKLAKLRSRIKATKAEGRMQVTNKRILFRAAGKAPLGKTVFQSEFDIARIEGVILRKDFRFKWLDFFISLGLYLLTFGLTAVLNSFVAEGEKTYYVFSILLGLASTIPFFAMKKHYRIKMLLSGIGLSFAIYPAIASIALDYEFLIKFGFSSAIYIFVIFVISLILSSLQPNLEVHILASSASPAIQVVEIFSGFDDVLPGEDVDFVIKEIGAMIDDIKTLGDFGIEKWKQN